MCRCASRQRRVPREQQAHGLFALCARKPMVTVPVGMRRRSCRAAAVPSGRRRRWRPSASSTTSMPALTPSPTTSPTTGVTISIVVTPRRLAGHQGMCVSGRHGNTGNPLCHCCEPPWPDQHVWPALPGASMRRTTARPRRTCWTTASCRAQRNGCVVLSGPSAVKAFCIEQGMAQLV